jgi:hypothetical protein
MGEMQQAIRPKGTFDMEALEELVGSLLEISLQGAAVIVEGRRDEQALRALGLRGPVIMASRRPALEIGRASCRERVYSDG